MRDLKQPSKSKLSLSHVLLLSALGSAALSALLLMPGAKKDEGEVDATSASPHPQEKNGDPSRQDAPLRDTTAPTEQESPEELMRRWEEIADDLDDMDVPSVEEARRMQLPKAEPRADIVERGIDALLPEPQCSLPAVFVKSARSGPGILGCAIEVSGQPPTVVGRAALQKHNRHFEVGEFERGKRQGMWREYYPSGVLASQGAFDDDQRTGAWDEFDEQGIHRVRRNYLYGQKYGATIRYSGPDPEVDLWSPVGQLDPETKKPLSQRVAVAP